MNQQAKQLVNEFEVQARFDISRLKVQEITADECADLITNHCVDYCIRADSLRFWWRWWARYEMRKLRDRLIGRLPVYAEQGLPDATAIFNAWQRGQKIELKQNPDGTVTHHIKPGTDIR